MRKGRDIISLCANCKSRDWRPHIQYILHCAHTDKCLQTHSQSDTRACAGCGGSVFLWIQAKTSVGNRVAVHTHAGRQSLRLGTSSTVRNCQPGAWGRHWKPSHSHQEIRLEPRVEGSRGITHFCKHCAQPSQSDQHFKDMQCDCCNDV